MARFELERPDLEVQTEQLGHALGASPDLEMRTEAEHADVWTELVSLLGPPAAAHEDRDVRVAEHTLEIVDLRTGIRIAGEEVAGSLDPLKCDQDQAWGLPGFGLLPDDRVALPSS